MMIKEFLPEEAQRPWKWIRNSVISLVGLCTLWGSNYNVPTSSEGVLQRFGAYKETTHSGIHFKWPFIERATIVPKTEVRTMEFGFRSSGRSPSNEELKREYLMLTGDKYMADVEMTMRYSVRNSKDFLFNIKGPEKTLRDAGLAVMREIVGDGSVDEILTLKRDEYQTRARDEVQKLLDSYKSGIDLQSVSIQKAQAPEKVRQAFSEVQNALAMKDRQISEAMGEYNKVVPEAKGQAQGLISSAEGYALERTNKALGDVAKFLAQYKAYKENPEITKKRLWFETMSKVTSGIEGTVIVDSDIAKGSLLFKVDLDKGNKLEVKK